MFYRSLLIGLLLVLWPTLQPTIAASAAQPFGFCAFNLPPNPGQVLYDSAMGTTPSQQQWQFITSPGALASEHYTDGATLLNTFTQTSDLAGYFAAPAPRLVLRRDAGFVITFTTQVLTETHNNQHRAGLSLIVIADDVRGIELGFWQDSVWAQGDGIHPPENPTPLFNQAEHAALTTTQPITYALRVLTDTYTLLANDIPVLTGPMRDYRAFEGLGNPYQTPNLLFIGDDTTSARAQVRLGSIAAQTCRRPMVYLPLASR